jgi:hypothetical protein
MRQYNKKVGDSMNEKENIKENYIGASEAGKMLNITRSRIGKLCLAGRFSGAVKIANSWIIPREAVLNHKPLPPGVKPRKAKLTAEREEILRQAKEAKAKD